MDVFQNAEAVRLQSHHNKYLIANPNGTTVSQGSNGSSKSAIWRVEPVPGTNTFVRLKSCFDMYLSASNKPLLFGFAGQKVTQSAPSRLDSSLEWEPLKIGVLFKFRTQYSRFLKANGAAPPLRAAVTHDIPAFSTTRDWILWSVEPVKLSPRNTPLNPDLDDSSVSSAPRSEGRIVKYRVMHQGDELADALADYDSLVFEGKSVAELTRKLMEKTGLDNVVVCTVNQVSRKLYPLRLQLPPSTSDMRVVVVSITTNSLDFEDISAWSF